MKTESEHPPPGWRIEWHKTVGSTNDLVKTRARSGAPSGLVLAADEQTSGRGRHGRSWIAPPKSSLLVSVLLRPTQIPPADEPAPLDATLLPIIPAEQAYLITMLAAVALCEAVEAVSPIQAALKWPNDLMLAGPDGKLRKAAGILAEVDIRSGMLAWIVLGIGINITWHPSGMIDGRDLRLHATSLYATIGKATAEEAPERMMLLHTLLRRIAAWNAALRGDGAGSLYATWAHRLATIGQHVAIQLPDRRIEGRAEGVEPSGALQVRDSSGQLQIVTTGEVQA